MENDKNKKWKEKKKREFFSFSGEMNLSGYMFSVSC